MGKEIGRKTHCIWMFIEAGVSIIFVVGICRILYWDLKWIILIIDELMGFES